MNETRISANESTGTSDRNVRGALLAVGITAEEMPAFEMFPCIAMAWTDNDVNVVEREAVRTIARQRGIRPISRAAAQIEDWLRRKPAPEVMELWLAWLASLDASDATLIVGDLRHWMVPAMRQVAHAGHRMFGGLNLLSARRRRLMSRVRSALDADF